MNITLIKGVFIAVCAWLGIVITYNQGILIHFQEGRGLISAAALLGLFLLLIKGLHIIYTAIRRNLRCQKLKFLRAKRKKDAGCN